ncbi:MAG: hypothetical protein AABZ31_10085 [Bdellovibrionota bacterium]
MKKQILSVALKYTALLVLTVMSTACANQWRETDESISEEDAFSLFNELSPQLNVASIATDENSAIYFTQSGEAGGLPESVMSFSDMSFLGFQGDVFGMGLEYVGVILADSYDNGQRTFALMIKTSGGAASSPFVATSTDYHISKDKFEVVFDTPAGALLLRSFDISDNYDDELAASIHLKAYILDANGNETPIGQFSSLRGFGG